MSGISRVGRDGTLAEKETPVPTHPEGTFGGPTSHTGGGDVYRGRGSRANTLGAVELKEGGNILGHRDSHSTSYTVMS